MPLREKNLAEAFFFVLFSKKVVTLQLQMEQTQVIQRITELGRKILPEGASLWLYGSRARGDARPDSYYDLLILLDKDSISPTDCNQYSYPLFYWGTGIGEAVNAQLYTKNEWDKWKLTPFNENVEEDKVVLI